MGKTDQIIQYAKVMGIKALKPADVTMLAREHCAEAIETLAAIMKNQKVKPLTRIMAADKILDRGVGKAPVVLQTQEMADPELEAAAALILAKRAGGTLEDQKALPAPRPEVKLPTQAPAKRRARQKAKKRRTSGTKE